MNLTPLQAEMLRWLLKRSPIISVRGGWGCGKASGIVLCLLVNARMHPGLSSLLIVDTADRYRSVHHPELEKWVCAEEYSSRWTWHSTDRKWEAPNGHIIWVRSYFRPSTRSSSHNPLEGLNISSGLVVIDEAQTMRQEVATKAIGRVRTGQPCMIICGLPVQPSWWVDMAEGAGCAPLFYTSHSNPHLSQEWFRAAKLTLTPAEYDSMLLNKPQPASGSVYKEFSEANIIEGWKYEPSMSGRIAIDFGLRQPCALIICHDRLLGADIICAEVAPRDCSLSDFISAILAVAWPRAEMDAAPGERIWIDVGGGDKAGAQRSDRTMTTSIMEMRQLPPEGFGVQGRYSTDPVRTDISNGVQRLQRALWKNLYRVTAEVYEAGIKQRASLRRALESYRWDPTGTKPIKDGSEHALDALRYDCIIWLWAETSVQRDHRPAKQRVRLAQRKTRGF